ncbi:PaaI family thioesterase [Nereida sp. MMG025]|uniref:PaaI family thioesterase n=1 Tax=Nereida sp. MMG025 TaxID=2909981 RepID=UPI001F38FF65|nr:PaaI family thioesterase [Nereida sp. MMG025]MCF6444989.1 PaaI family thioesterase [Nereida sp. MMG025]
MDQAVIQNIRDSFDKQALMATFQARMTRIEEGEVEICAPILPLATQQHGFAHAGMTFAIGDSAAGYAALTMMPKGQDVLTTEMKINLMRPAGGDMLRAVGTVLKAGRLLTVVEAKVYADGKLCAALQGTMIGAPKG